MPVMTRATGEEARLAELLGGLSLACDLADGFPPEKVLRTVVLAVELGKLHGLSAEALREVYYTTIVRYVGCTAFSHEEAHVYGAGDDIGTRSTMALADGAHPLDVLSRVVRGIGKGAPLAQRVRAVASMLSDPGVLAKHARAQCEASIRMAGVMGLGEGVRTALNQICERYDGKGAPHGVAGEALTQSIRFSHVADLAEIAHHRQGRGAALELVRTRSGEQLDPGIARTFLRNADALFTAIEGDAPAHPTSSGLSSVWERFLECEPTPRAQLGPELLGAVARAFGEFGDVKSTFTLGHSAGVVELALRAAQALGLSAEDTLLVQHAAWLHDIGRVAVPNGIWDKPGRLSVSEWERVRLHAYYTERIVWRCPPLRAVAQVASAAHERMDSHGYHRAIAGTSIGKAARILAAADAYQAMRSLRPHRPALDAEAAARALREDARTGRLDREAVAAVLDAAGERARSRTLPSVWPNGLTDREVEVLRRLARGHSNKAIGQELSISARTVQHHVMHIYDKIGVSSRAAAALFATDHALLEP